MVAKTYVAMRIASDDDVLTSRFLSEALTASPGWRHGSLRVVSASRIGTEYGMSGLTHRVVVQTECGDSLSFIVKQERAEAVERELLFRIQCGEFLHGCVAECFGGLGDSETGRGVLFFEDVSPAEQGDVLHGCSDDRAAAAVRVLARLHAGSWKANHGAFPPELPRWGAQPMEPDRWVDRVARACQRFPRILTSPRAAWLGDLPGEVASALDQLRDGPAAWIQVDTHLDNVLWRSDGTAVLLDWCDAAIGPPSADLARFLSEGIDARSRPALVETYVQELRISGADGVLTEVDTSLELALLHLLQSAIGWAGRENLVLHGRSADVCQSWLRSVCGWALAEDSGSQEGRSAT
jgi:hypothetical protein